MHPMQQNFKVAPKKLGHYLYYLKILNKKISIITLTEH